ncbi:MAG: hypothetical protein U5L98_01415 [Halomonas sp.]|uniref:hypothetical protein n=1 Tax=Halomonas sp. TaxID=1486246 RepID=UPI002ACDF9B1|nr:hypothetical protein [Halomonas sp.]MDZ7851327.1 hypothetical protein [Halomonas sp.]
MDTRENKTPEERLQQLREVSQPEDFEHPEPDEDQPEAKESTHGLHRVLPIVIVVVGVLAAAMLLLSGNSN